MKPEYWIGIMALVGAVIGYILFQTIGWLDTGMGTAIGILVGVIIYSRLKDRQTPKE